jgi:hypothetical protein
MEAVVHAMSCFSLGEVQKECVSSSYKYVLIRKATAVVSATKLKCLTLERPEAYHTLATCLRSAKLVTGFSRGGKRCLERFRGQVEKRLASPSEPDIIAMLVDPRTKHLPASLFAGTGLVLLRAAAHARLLDEHRVVYRKLNGQPPASSTGVSAVADACSVVTVDSDTDDDEIFGVPRPQKKIGSVGQTQEQLDREADAVVEDWMSLVVPWEDSTKANILAVGKEHLYDMWKVYAHIDVLEWFKSNGEALYPSIALLARVYLAKPMSNAYQERVFSTVGNIMTAKRTCLEPCRAEKLQVLKQNWKARLGLADE